MTELKEDNRNSGLYPNIVVNPDPSAPVAVIEMTDNGQSFRLSKISDVQKFLEDEIRYRGSLSKKFLKYSKISDGAEGALTVATLGAGAGGIALLSTVVAIPMTIGLEAFALVSGLAAITLKFFTRRARTKGEKHGEIKNIASAKLDTVNSHISKAIADNKISHEEFSLIMEELEKYKEMKEEIRSKVNKKKEIGGTKQLNRKRKERSAVRVSPIGRKEPASGSTLLNGFKVPNFSFSCSCMCSNIETEPTKYII